MDDEGWSWVGQGWHRRVTGRGIVRPGAVRRQRAYGCAWGRGRRLACVSRWMEKGAMTCTRASNTARERVWESSEAMKQGRQRAARSWSMALVWRGVRSSSTPFRFSIRGP